MPKFVEMSIDAVVHESEIFGVAVPEGAADESEEQNN